MLDELSITSRYSREVVPYATGTSVTFPNDSALELYIGREKLEKFIGGLHHIDINMFSRWGCEDRLTAVPSRIHFSRDDEDSQRLHVWLRDPKIWLCPTGHVEPDGKHLMMAVIQGRLYGHPEVRRGAAAIFSDMTLVFTNGRRWNFWELEFPDQKSRFRVERPKNARARSKVPLLENV